jgi:hypothetical protein
MVRSDLFKAENAIQTVEAEQRLLRSASGGSIRRFVPQPFRCQKQYRPDKKGDAQKKDRQYNDKQPVAFWGTNRCPQQQQTTKREEQE